MKKLLFMTLSLLAKGIGTFTKFSGLTSIMRYLKVVYFFNKIRASWTIHNFVVRISDLIFKIASLLLVLTTVLRKIAKKDLNLYMLILAFLRYVKAKLPFYLGNIIFILEGLVILALLMSVLELNNITEPLNAQTIIQNIIVTLINLFDILKDNFKKIIFFIFFYTNPFNWNLSDWLLNIFNYIKESIASIIEWIIKKLQTIKDFITGTNISPSPGEEIESMSTSSGGVENKSLAHDSEKSNSKLKYIIGALLSLIVLSLFCYYFEIKSFDDVKNVQNNTGLAALFASITAGITTFKNNIEDVTHFNAIVDTLRNNVVINEIKNSIVSVWDSCYNYIFNFHSTTTAPGTGTGTASGSTSSLFEKGKNVAIIHPSLMSTMLNSDDIFAQLLNLREFFNGVTNTVMMFIEDNPKLALLAQNHEYLISLTKKAEEGIACLNKLHDELYLKHYLSPTEVNLIFEEIRSKTQFLNSILKNLNDFLPITADDLANEHARSSPVSSAGSLTPTRNSPVAGPSSPVDGGLIPIIIFSAKVLTRQKTLISLQSTSRNSRSINTLARRNSSQTFVLNDKDLGIEKLLTKELISFIINKFWSEIMEKIKDDQYSIFAFRIEWEKGNYVTFDRVHKLEKNHKDDLIERFQNLYDLKNEEYKILIINKIVLEYFIKNKSDSSKPIEVISSLQKLTKKINPDKDLNYITNKLSSLNIPLNQKYKTWGQVIANPNNDNLFLLIQDTNNKDKYYHISKNDKEDYYEIEIRIKNKRIMKIFDFRSFYGAKPVSANSFIRVINNYEFYIHNNKIILKTIKFKTDYLKTIKKERKLIDKIITLDIETRVENNQHIPYCVCYYDGKIKHSYYVTDFKDHKDMIINAIQSLLKPKYSGYSIYVHNLSNFDGIFLLNSFVSITDSSDNNKIKITPILKDGKMIVIKIKFGKYNISFKDSFLLLPLSLKKLAIQFNVNHLKTIFPYNFVNDKFNQHIDLNYFGMIPDIKFFDNDMLQVIELKNIYLKFIENFLDTSPDKDLKKWSLKSETIKYCMNDCVSLYEILINFNQVIFNKFSLNINNFPTLPSLTFGIFRANFLNKINKLGYNIPLIKGEMFEDLKKSYTGGATEMYIPSNSDDNEGKVYGYDVNSLYPTNMSKGFYMPVISKKINYITYFEGNLYSHDLPNNFTKNAFGFFNVDLKTFKEIQHPILQIKHNTGNGIRTISPLGRWNFTYFSDELKNATKFGYKFNVINGYLFDKFDIFAEFIMELYKIKQSHKKEDSWYAISKLLMNSLYGRFGMDPNFDCHDIINFDKLDEYLDHYEVKDFKNLDNQKILISYVDVNKREDSKMSFLGDSHKNVSIAIASAITAYARIFMSKFKNNLNYKIFYTDTDSLYISAPLENKFIGNNLGQFKLEQIFNKVVFIAPKVYGGITDDGKEITKVKGYKKKISFRDFF